MKLQQYIIESERTLIDKGHALNLLHARTGIFTEIGELLDQFKKHIYYDKELDEVNIKEELGDVMWYCAIHIREHEIDPYSIKPYGYKDIYDKMASDKDDKLEVYQMMIDDLISTNPRSLQSIFYTVYAIADYFKFDLDDILQTNINKLKARFPHKFTSEKALNRDLEKERQILEGVN